MKKIIKTLKTDTKLQKALIVAGVVLVAGYGIYSASRPDVGVIDFNAVQTKAKVYQYVVEQQQKYEADIRTRMKADSTGLEKDFKKLEEQKAKTKPAEFQKKLQALQKRAALIQNKYRPDVERIMLASQIALKGVEKDIALAVEATANQTGVKVLLPMNNVLYAKKSVDLTDKFVKNLDKRVDKVLYPDPKKLAQ